MKNVTDLTRTVDHYELRGSLLRQHLSELFT
jgi:hypothetical protein